MQQAGKVRKQFQEETTQQIPRDTDYVQGNSGHLVTRAKVQTGRPRRGGA